MRATQTVQRPHVRRCGGGGRAQLTHRSDAGSAIEPSNTIYTSNQEVREITTSDSSRALVTVVKIFSSYVETRKKTVYPTRPDGYCVPQGIVLRQMRRASHCVKGAGGATPGISCFDFRARPGHHEQWCVPFRKANFDVKIEGRLFRCEQICFGEYPIGLGARA